jgi:hypothetical protein
VAALCVAALSAWLLSLCGCCLCVAAVCVLQVQNSDVKLAAEAETLALTSPDTLEALNERAAARCAAPSRSLHTAAWLSRSLLQRGAPAAHPAIRRIEPRLRSAVYMTKVRNLLESQLYSMKGIGAYAIIGCDPEASDKELAAKYRDAARKAHPDRGGDKATFQRLQVSPRSEFEFPPWPARSSSLPSCPAP